MQSILQALFKKELDIATLVGVTYYPTECSYKIYIDFYYSGGIYTKNLNVTKEDLFRIIVEGRLYTWVKDEVEKVWTCFDQFVEARNKHEYSTDQ